MVHPFRDGRAIEEEQTASGQYTLLQSGAAAALAHQARERLLRWQVDYTSAPQRQAFELETDCASFLTWSGRFERYLDDKGLATTGDCVTRLVAGGRRRCRLFRRCSRLASMPLVTRWMYAILAAHRRDAVVAAAPIGAWNWRRPPAGRMKSASGSRRRAHP